MTLLRSKGRERVAIEMTAGTYRNHAAAAREMMLTVVNAQAKYANNRAQVSHVQTRVPDAGVRIMAHGLSAKSLASVYGARTDARGDIIWGHAV